MADIYTVLDINKYTSVSDYKLAADNSDGIVMRVGYRGSGTSGTMVTDSKFSTFYTNFNKEYAKIGVYWTTQAVTETEAEKEATYVYNLIKDKNISFPVYVHSAESGGRADYMSAEDRTQLILVFLNKIKEYGYRGGVIASNQWFNEGLEYSTLASTEDLSIWVTDTLSSGPTLETYDAWMYTRDGEFTGISGTVDISYFYTDVAGWKEIRPIGDYVTGITPEEFTYSGEPNEPVPVSETLLVEKVDYTISYEDNINAGTGKAIIKGVHGYNGSVPFNFTINPQSIELLVPSIDPVTYTGGELKPTAKMGDLVQGTDFTATYENNINAGTGKANLTGIGNYTGVNVCNFDILRQPMSQHTMVTDRATYKYTGEPIIPSVTIDSLVKDVDYTLSYENNVEIGTGIVTATGIGNYTGTISTTFVISLMSLEDYTLEIYPKSFVYNSAIQWPTRAVVGDLIEGVHYQMLYPNNSDNIGTYTAIAQGIGEYDGQITANFNITPKTISAYTPTIPEGYEYYYCSDYIEPVVSIENLVEGRDFTVLYTNNYNISTGSILARATLFGTGNYNGSTYVEFKILQSDISRTIAKFGDPSYKTIYRIKNDEGLKIYASQKAYENDKYPLIEYFDYVLMETKTEVIEDFTLYTFNVKGLSNYSGSATFRFRIIDEEPSTPIDYYDDGVYNFGDIDTGDESANGDYNFQDIDNPETPAPTDPVQDGSDFDFDKLSTMLLDYYDEDNGHNIDKDGNTEREEPIVPIVDDDDGVYNFGDIDLGDETAVGDYDFGDLLEGVEEDNVSVGDYDFNILSGDKESGYAPGTEFVLRDMPLYATYCAKTSSAIKSGTYYIYDSVVMNRRIRITKMEDGVEEPVRASGWVLMEDLENIDKIKVGDVVFVNGNITILPNATGGYIEKVNEIMYVVGAEDEAFENRYALASSPTNNIQGYANFRMLTKTYDV